MKIRLSRHAQYRCSYVNARRKIAFDDLRATDLNANSRDWAEFLLCPLPKKRSTPFRQFCNAGVATIHMRIITATISLPEIGRFGSKIRRCCRSARFSISAAKFRTAETIAVALFCIEMSDCVVKVSQQLRCTNFRCKTSDPIDRRDRSRKNKFRRHKKMLVRIPFDR